MRTDRRVSRSEPASEVSEPKPDGPPRGFRRVKDAAISLSLANLIFIQSWFGLLFTEDSGYFNKVPVNAPSLLALCANLLLFAAVFWAASIQVRRTPNVWLKLAARLTLCALLLIPLNFVRLELLGVRGATLTALLNTPLGIALGLALVTAVARWSPRAARMAIVAVVILLPLTCFTFGRLALAFFKPEARSARPTPSAPPPAAQGPPPPRVVWIVFDEMDQRLAFAQRPASLRLPELDRLRQQSLYAPNAYPPACNTRLSMPALTTGRSVSSAHPGSAHELLLTLADTQQTVGWSAQPTVFSRARALGVRTGLVGWYHPYSRLFGSVLDYCEWYPYPPFEQARDWTFGAAMANQVCAMISPWQQRRLQARLYENTLRDAKPIVTNAAFGLVLLHLAEPHLPCIYSPTRRRLTTFNFSRTQGYLANLELTDRTLGELRRALEQAGLWEQTWVLISSDHWWRESPLYDGKTDHRVPFIIKPAGTNQPAVYAPAFNTILTADLLLAILQREIARGDQLPAWLDAYRSEPPASYPGAYEP